MPPRLDEATTRQLWAAFWVAAVLFLVAIVIVLARMSSSEPVVHQNELALGGSAVSGTR